MMLSKKLRLELSEHLNHYVKLYIDTCPESAIDQIMEYVYARMSDELKQYLTRRKVDLLFRLRLADYKQHRKDK